MDTTPTDELGALIVEKGFAPSLGVLDMNHSLSVERNRDLPAPWNLPSRLFQFPIEVRAPDGDQPRKLGLRHPDLAAHPFVQHVEAELGITLDPNGAPNRHGYSSAETAQYHHAVDLISAGMWRELIETLDFTTPGAAFQAITYGLRYGNDADHRKRAGYISTVEARAIMEELGASEPDDRRAAILNFSAPMPCNPDGKSEHWPINGRTSNGEDAAWAFIHGVEDGWFELDRSLHLQWSELGRSRYAAGEETTFTEVSGQAAFAF